MSNTGIKEYSPIDAALARLREKYHGKLYDVTTTDGMAEARKARREIKGYRVDLEKIRKQIKAPALERCRMIDSEAKRITVALEEVECPIDDQIKAEEYRLAEEKIAAERAEALRVEGIREAIAQFSRAVFRAAGAPVEQVQKIHNWLEARVVKNDEFQEFTEEAAEARVDAIERVSSMLAEAKRNAEEAERLRVEREAFEASRKEAEERDRAERERREVEESRLRLEREEVERQKRDAEAQAAREEADRKAEQDRKAAVEARMAEVAKRRMNSPEAALAVIHGIVSNPMTEDGWDEIKILCEANVEANL